MDNGLKWLAKQVNSDAYMNQGGDSIAISALAGIAFLADGSLPNDGRYGRESQKLLEQVLKNCQESGLIAEATRSK